MASLYKVNAKLKFQTSNSSTPTGTDPITGEPIFDSSEVIVEASLEQSGNMNEEVLQGTDETKTYLVGRCINPKTLTDEQRKIQKVPIEIEIGDTFYTGQFEFKPNPSSRLGLEKWFGEQVEGYFSIDV